MISLKTKAFSLHNNPRDMADPLVMGDRLKLHVAASNITKLAHLVGVTLFILLLIWLLHYREGINYNSTNFLRVFNVHPLLMVLGLILCSGEALMAFKSVPMVSRQVSKTIHMLLNLTGFVLGVIGIRAVFKSNTMMGFTNMYSLHSWIGIATISFLALQWLVGFFTFMAGGASEYAKRQLRPWHICFGRAVFIMGIAAALTGLMEKATVHTLNNLHIHENVVVNFIAVTILLFGLLVDFSISLPHS